MVELHAQDGVGGSQHDLLLLLLAADGVGVGGGSVVQIEK